MALARFTFVAEQLEAIARGQGHGQNLVRGQGSLKLGGHQMAYLKDELG